jgi:hypothetical protein
MVIMARLALKKVMSGCASSQHDRTGALSNKKAIAGAQNRSISQPPITRPRMTEIPIH